MTEQIFLDCDLHSSTKEYQQRFSGKVGEWFLELQNNLVREFLKKINFTNEQTALDIGGGHAQILPILLEKSKQISLLVSSKEALGLAKKNQEENNLQFYEGNLLSSQVSNDSFDLVVSFRIISHSENWQKFVSELCRISSKYILIDYPTYQSFNIISFLLFSLKKRIEGNTRTFITFWDSELSKEFEKHGFSPIYKKGQFVVPMGVHRGFKNIGLSKILEKIAKLFLLQKCFASPVVIGFEKR